MINKVVELNEVMPSQNEWERMNPYVKPKFMLKQRDKILMLIGEGPWKKVYLKKKFNADIKRRVVEQLREEWPKKRRAYITFHVRRHKRLDKGNLIGGHKPLLDALQWSGWCVTDHPKWVNEMYPDQELGDPKTVISIEIPENDEEERLLSDRYDGKAT